MGASQRDHFTDDVQVAGVQRHPAVDVCPPDTGGVVARAELKLSDAGACVTSQSALALVAAAGGLLKRLRGEKFLGATK